MAQFNMRPPPGYRGLQSMRIADWPEDERPRERLLKLGPAALSEAELIAIFFRTGIRGQERGANSGAILLARFGSLRHLFAASLDEVSAVHGLGPAKYAQLQAVVEIARRALAEEIGDRDVMTSPQRCSRLSRVVAGQSPARGIRRDVSRRAEPPAGLRRTFSRHADADQRLPARSRQDGVASQCGRP